MAWRSQTSGLLTYIILTECLLYLKTSGGWGERGIPACREERDTRIEAWGGRGVESGRAGGCTHMGIDMRMYRCDHSNELCADLYIHMSNPGLAKTSEVDLPPATPG